MICSVFHAPIGFAARFKLIDEAHKAELSSLPFEAVPYASTDEMHFAVYVRSRLLIEANAWDKAGVEDLINALTKLAREGDEARKTAMTAFWILVEENYRKDIAKHLLSKRTFEFYPFRETFGSLSFMAEDWNDIAELVNAHTQSDIAARFVFELLKAWSKLHTSEAIRFIKTYEETAPLNFVLEMLRGIIDTNDADVALDCFNRWIDPGSQLKHIRVALYIIPDLTARDKLTIKKALQHIATYISDEDVNKCDAAITSLGQLLDNRVTDELISLLRRTALDDRLEIKWRVSQIIWTSKKEEVKALGRPFLETVTDLDSAAKGVVSNIDYVLSDFVETDLEVVEWFFHEWVRNHQKDGPRSLTTEGGFPHTFFRVNEKDRAFLNELGTRWLLMEPQFAEVGAFFIQEYEYAQFITSHIDDVDDEQFTCLVERTLAFYFDAKQRFTLLYSLIPLCVSEMRWEVLQSAFEESCLNYYGAASDFKATLSVNSNTEHRVKQTIQSTLDSYYQPRESRSELKEFYPPAERAEAYYRFQNKQQAEAKEASGESSIMSLVSKVSIGRGDSWVTNRPDGTASEPSGFSEFSYSLEFPRLELLDPDEEAWKRIIRTQRLKPTE